MNVYQSVGINFYAILILLIILINVLFRKKRYSVSYRFLVLLIILIIVAQCLEIAGWILLSEAPRLRRLNLVLASLYHLCGALPGAMLLSYIDYQLYGSILRLRRRLYYLYPFVIYAIIFFASSAWGFVFMITEDGEYVRGQGIMLSSAVNVLLILYALFMVSARRKRSERRHFLTLLSFTLLPLAAVVVQLNFLGLNLAWPGVAAGVLITYLFLELQQETRDYLTGLYNRQQIDELVNYRISRNRTHGSFSLVMIDLDGFKSINDTYGHEEGDRALIIFANVLSRSTKRIDIVARFAGDEFLILFESTDRKSVELIMERLQLNLDFENSRNGLPYNLRFSWGASVFDSGRHRSYSELLQEADEAMYRQKLRHKGRR